LRVRRSIVRQRESAMRDSLLRVRGLALRESSVEGEDCESDFVEFLDFLEMHNSIKEYNCKLNGCLEFP
jgi:hypothetical protein